MFRIRNLGKQEIIACLILLFAVVHANNLANAQTPSPEREANHAENEKPVHTTQAPPKGGMSGEAIAAMVMLVILLIGIPVGILTLLFKRFSDWLWKPAEFPKTAAELKAILDDSYRRGFARGRNEAAGDLLSRN